MANPFDQFDSSEGSGNPFDAFDEKLDISGTLNPMPDAHLDSMMAWQNPGLAIEKGVPLPPVGDAGNFWSGAWEELNTPFKQLSRKEGATSTLGKVSQGVANAGIGIAEGLETPLGVSTLGIGLLPKTAIKLAGLAFGGLATKGAADAAGEATAMEPSLNPLTWSPERTDVSKLAEAGTYGALVPFLARPTVKLGENVALTKGDALGIASRRMEQATRGNEPLAISDPAAPRQLGLQVPPEPFLNPGVREMASRALSDAQKREIMLPGQEAPLAALRRAVEPPQIEGVEINQRVRPGGGLAEGGQISFAGEAAAKAIPSARQSALEAGVLRSGFDAIGDRVVAGMDRAQRVTGPDAPSYRRPVPAPTIEQAQAVARRANVEKGLEIPEIPMEPLAPDVAQFPVEGMPKGTFSKLQRSRILAGQKNVRSNVRNTPPAEKNPAISKLESEINVEPGKFKAGNALTQEVGMQLRSVDDLSRIQKLNESVTEAMQAAKSSGDFTTAMELALKRQILRETVETATNTGSWTEATGARKLGARPLDVATSPEAAAWLAENGKKLGIKMEPVAEAAVTPELAAPAPGTTRLYQGSGGAAGAGQGGAYWSAKPDYARSFGPKVEYIDVPTKDLSAFDVRKLEGSGTPDTYKLPPELSKGAKAHPEIAQKVFDLDTPQGMLDKLDSKLADVQNNIRNGKTFTGVTGLEPVMLDAAIVAARAAIKATKSVKAGIDAAIAYIKEKFPNAKFNPEELAEWVNKNASDSIRTEGKAAGKVSASLDDVYKIFEPEPKKTTPIRAQISGAIESVRTGLSSKFRPIDKLAEDIAKQYGLPRNRIAGVFEQLKGSSGKGEASIYRFDRAVSDLVKGSEKDFNAYMFLRRGIDRLNNDLRDINRAVAGEDVPKLNRRSVGNYIIPELQSKLDFLTSKLGVEKIAKFEKAAEAYQSHMDQALRLQVESGRMSPELYRAIKDGNQFYAPFKVMKYIEDSFKAEGSGSKIDTLADFTKKMEGIESADFKLGDMLGAARHNILLSRILADKNMAMRKISDLAATDVDGVFIRKVAEGVEAPKGMELVNVMEGGKVQKYAVDKAVADSVQIFTGKAQDIASTFLAKAAIPFRASATVFNVGFQVSNLLADVPRAALVSRYGIRGVSDLVRFPLDLVDALYTSMQGNVLGKKNKLFLDFLDSGVAGSTVQSYLTPAGLRFQEPTAIGRSSKLAKTVINTMPDFAQAIEQTPKIVGVKRAMRFEGVKSGAELAKKIPEAITEIRRFSGSPDFGRMGKWTESYRLNLIYMFLNARIQGVTADLGRLVGRDGGGTAARTWGKMGTAVGIPTAYLYLLNNSEEYADDYAKLSDQEKENYWHIPKDSFITTESGEKLRDYWRIPKREVSKWISNMVESGLNFANERDSEALGKWGVQMVEEIVPINIQGDSFQERLESVGASLNPLFKAPIEAATGRDLYRHKPIVPMRQQKAPPKMQYTDRTAEVFKTLAGKMPDAAPDMFQSPLMLENMARNLGAGMLTQFLPRKPVEGRSALENQPLLQRFQRLPFTSDSAFDDKMQQYERDSAGEQLTRFRSARELIQGHKGGELRPIIQELVNKHGPDEKLVDRVVDMWIADRVGITYQDRRILNLPVQQRARFIADEIKNMPPEEKGQVFRDYARKRILTEAVAEELINLLPDAK